MYNFGHGLNSRVNYLQYRVQKVNPENLCVKNLEGTNVCTETNDTSEESPNTQLYIDTLKMGVALSWGRDSDLQ